MNVVLAPRNVFKIVVAVLVLNIGWASPSVKAQFAFSTPIGLAGMAGTLDGSNGNARFNQPAAIAVDASGVIYVADTMNHTVRRIIRSGALWSVGTIAGLPGVSGNSDGTNATARFYYPYGLALGGSGFIYVADTYNHTIRQVSASGTNWVVTTLAGSPGAQGSSDGARNSAGFYYPSGIAVSPSGSLYVADSYNHAIREVTSDGVVTTIAGAAGVDGIIDGTNGSARFYYPSGIAADLSGNLFVADTYNSLIRKISRFGADWITTTLVGLPRYSGSADGTNRYAQFNYPFGIATGPGGSVYVADTLNDTLRAVAPAGADWAVSTIGGLARAVGSSDGSGQAVRFNLPYGLAVDGTGNLVVADSYNHTIRFGQPGFSLQAALVMGQIVLSWPASASNYILETSGTPNASASWTAQSSGISLSGDRFVKTNAITPGPAFFRLRLP
jgi:sugar lactone lactonase YvrE